MGKCGKGKHAPSARRRALSLGGDCLSRLCAAFEALRTPYMVLTMANSHLVLAASHAPAAMPLVLLGRRLMPAPGIWACPLCRHGELRPPPHQVAHSVPAVRPPLLPHPEEHLRLLRLPCCQDPQV